MNRQAFPSRGSGLGPGICSYGLTWWPLAAAVEARRAATRDKNLQLEIILIQTRRLFRISILFISSLPLDKKRDAPAGASYNKAKNIFLGEMT